MRQVTLLGRFPVNMKQVREFDMTIMSQCNEFDSYKKYCDENDIQYKVEDVEPAKYFSSSPVIEDNRTADQKLNSLLVWNYLR